MAEALSSTEWLQAARAVLGPGTEDDLRLVDVVAAAAEPASTVGDAASIALGIRSGAAGETRRVGLFLKHIPKDNPALEAVAADTRVFHKESGLFALLARLAPRLRNGTLQPWGARCLLNRPRLMLFEDLSGQGFKMLGVRSSLDFAHCAAALDALARLHAASLALEEADRRARRLNPWRLGDRFPDPLQEVVYSEDFPNPLNAVFHSGLKAARAVIDRMHEFKDSPRYNDIVSKLEDLPMKAYEIVKASDKHRNVICHGELCVSNILFRYSSWGQVAEARLVDLQQTRYGPPALDVAALLHLCTRRSLREERGAELRDLYHSALTRALTDAGFPSSEGLLTRSAFDTSWPDYVAFGPIVAATTLPGTWLPPNTLKAHRENVDDPQRFLTGDRSHLVVEEFERDADYRERVGEVVSELVHKVLLRK